MNKIEKLIREYVLNTKTFTWNTDIAEHTIWGFKNSPYKTFTRAINKVKSVVAQMEEEGIIVIVPDEGDYQSRISLK